MAKNTHYNPKCVLVIPVCMNIFLIARKALQKYSTEPSTYLVLKTIKLLELTSMLPMLAADTFWSAIPSNQGLFSSS